MPRRMEEATYMDGWPPSRPNSLTHDKENISKPITIPIICIQEGWGKPDTWLAGDPVGQIRKSPKAAPCQSTAAAGAAFPFLQIWPAGWPANHVSGVPHPFWAYIDGIAI